MNFMNSATKKLRQHKLTMIGDRIRENVELSLSNKFGTHGIVKPAWCGSVAQLTCGI
jgi:hypothetical protein